MKEKHRLQTGSLQVLRLFVLNLFLLLLYCSPLHGQNEVSPGDSLELAPYRGYGVELKFPASWEVIQDHSRYIHVLFSNQDTTGSDSLFENIALGTERVLFQSLRGYFKLCKRVIKRDNLDVIFLSEGKKQVNQNPSQWLIFTHKFGGRTFKAKHYYFVKHNTAYLLMLTTSVENFEKDEKIFEQVLGTFRITR